jgi:hypothetical protein
MLDYIDLNGYHWADSRLLISDASAEISVGLHLLVSISQPCRIISSNRHLILADPYNTDPRRIRPHYIKHLQDDPTHRSQRKNRPSKARAGMLSLVDLC